MGFVSNAAETDLIGVADSNQPAAVVALDQMQGRTPIVWMITALVAVLSLAIQRTSLVSRWLGVVGLIAAAIFSWARSSASWGAPRGELFTRRGRHLHRLDAAARRWPVAHRGKQLTPTPLTRLGSPFHWPPTARKTRWV
jgi:hypothetical protein